VHGRIAILYAAIVAGADHRSLFIENGGADGDAAFGESFAGFGDGDGEHGVVVERVSHWRDYTRVRLACGRLACRIVSGSGISRTAQILALRAFLTGRGIFDRLSYGSAGKKMRYYGSDAA
jgi:hypothetical protein